MTSNMVNITELDILSEKERKIVECLLDFKGECVARSELATAIYQGYPLDSNVIDVHVKNLRRKLGAKSEFYPITIRGIGYKIS